ncbi:Uncharacterised protein [Chlamydia trachomatis]|nr:Uncharacterised protein [Chlamydia trachomatis]
MMRKEEMLQIIDDGRRKADILRTELDKTQNVEVRNCIKKELSFLEDNTYRYVLQAKAYGYI